MGIILRLSLFCALSGFLFSNQVFAADQSALALAVVPGVSSTLDGKSEQVAVKMRIPVKASVTSDSTGKAQFMFPDDSTVSLAPETQIELVDFVDTPDEENVIMNMSKGVARFITGELSKRNPAAFTVQTPQAVIGVRGTVVTVEVSGDVTRVYLTETSGKGVTVRNRNTGETIRMRHPGTLITVGPKGMEDRKASAEEAKMFAQLLRGKYRAVATRKQQSTPAIAAARLKLAAQGNLPFTNAVDAAQMDEYNRVAMLNNATLVAQAGGSSSSRPTPVVPVVPVVPPMPDNPSTTPSTPVTPVSPGNTPTVPDTPSNPGNTPTVPDTPGTTPVTPDTPSNPGNTPTTPDVPDVPEVPDTPTTPDTPVVVPDEPALTPPVENYMITLADVAGTYSADVTIDWGRFNGEDSFTTSGLVSFTVPSNYVSVNGDTAEVLDLTISLGDLNIPTLADGVPSQTNISSVNSRFQTMKASPVASILARSSGNSVDAIFGEVNGDRFQGLTRVIVNGTDKDGTTGLGIGKFTDSVSLTGAAGERSVIPLTKR